MRYAPEEYMDTNVAELAVVLPCLNEAGNLHMLLPKIREVLSTLGTTHQVYVIDGGSTDDTVSVAESLGVVVIRQRGGGYGGAIRTAFEDIRATWLLTMDADFSHHPVFIKYLFARRHEGEIIIASRYAAQGYGEMPWSRKVLSYTLNRVFGLILSLNVRDLSSGFRLYHRNAISKLDLQYETYAVLQEILTKAWCRGYRVVEEPFHYLPRRHGSSHARVFKFGLVYLQSLYTLWAYRNSLQSADYEARAFYSRIPLQRWWQRRRCLMLRDFIGDRVRVLDVGCGSSQLLNNVPQAVGADTNPAKLRFMRRPARMLINASACALPFPDNAFEVIVASQLVEHLPGSDDPFAEMARCLEPGGTLIIGTPDYGRRRWRVIKRVYDTVQPGAPADRHPSKYTLETLQRRLEQSGFKIQDYRHILGAEVIVKAKKNL
jgi:dolichol-phosphate mannosyltransferase